MLAAVGVVFSQDRIRSALTMLCNLHSFVKEGAEASNINSSVSAGKGRCLPIRAWHCSAVSRFIDPSKCATQFAAPRNTSGSLSVQEFKVRVEVVSADTGASTAKGSIFITRPPSRYYLFVLDATERMKTLHLQDSGVSLYDSMIAQVTNAIHLVDVGGGFFGATVFGGAAYPQGTVDCERVEPLYPLSPIEAVSAENSVHNLSVAGESAPLFRAVSSALKEYAPYRDEKRERPNDRFLFVIITGGGDTCGGGNLISLLKSTLNSNELRGVAVGNRLLRMVVAVAKQENETELDRLLHSSAYNDDEQPTPILKVTSTETLSRALNAIPMRQRGPTSG